MALGASAQVDSHGDVPVKAVNWFFRNRHTGKITIAQFPNPPLWIFLGAWVVQQLADESSSVATIADYVATGSLGWWAVDEVARGVNPWRRTLGCLGVGVVIMRIVRTVSGS